jgi:hypothetical protein
MNRRVWGPSAGLIVVLAVALSACGGADTSTGADQAAEPSTVPRAPAGAMGTVAAVNASDIQVQNPGTGQVRVTFTSSTSFTKTVPATSGDLAVGQCASATAAPQAASASQPTGNPTAPLTATLVRINSPTADGVCTPGGFGGPRGVRGGGPDNGSPNGAASSRNPNRPNGAGRGRGGAATGKITSVSGDSFVVQLGSSNITRSVVTTQTTTFSKTITTDKSSVAVGECVTALGPSDDTGAVTATSISIRQPGPNGCQSGFGGAGRSGRGG